MTPKTLKITIDDRDSLRSETLRRVNAVTEDPDSAAEWDDGEVTAAFPSYDVLTTHLTPARLELLRAIAEHEPESVSETAALVDRDVGDVSRDLQRLDALDLVALDEGGPGKPTRPIVPYDRIEITIDYPLIDEDTGDETRADA